MIEKSARNTALESCDPNSVLFSLAEPDYASDLLFAVGRWYFGVNSGLLFAELKNFISIGPMIPAEDDGVEQVCQRVLAILCRAADAPASVGAFRVDMAELTYLQPVQLLRGDVQAIDNILSVHGSLIFNGTWIHVCLISATRANRPWVHHLLRRAVIHVPALVRNLTARLEARQKRRSVESHAAESRVVQIILHGLGIYPSDAYNAHDTFNLNTFGTGLLYFMFPHFVDNSAFYVQMLEPYVRESEAVTAGEWWVMARVNTEGSIHNGVDAVPQGAKNFKPITHFRGYPCGVKARLRNSVWLLGWRNFPLCAILVASCMQRRAPSKVS